MTDFEKEKKKALDAYLKRAVFARKLHKAAGEVAKTAFTLFVIVLGIVFVGSIVNALVKSGETVTISSWAVPFIVLGAGLFPALILLIVSGVLAKPLAPLGDQFKGGKREGK